MQIARSNPLSIPFSFDPKCIVRQILALLEREFGGAAADRHMGTAQAPGLAAYEPRLARGSLTSQPHKGRRLSPYAARWG